MPRTLSPLEALLLRSIRELLPYAESRCEDMTDATEAVLEPEEREEARHLADLAWERLHRADLAWERLHRAAAISEALAAAFPGEVASA